MQCRASSVASWVDSQRAEPWSQSRSKDKAWCFACNVSSRDHIPCRNLTTWRKMFGLLPRHPKVCYWKKRECQAVCSRPRGLPVARSSEIYVGRDLEYRQVSLLCRSGQRIHLQSQKPFAGQERME